jgi:hypothetical protein
MVDDLQARIGQAMGIDITEYYLVSDHGVLQMGTNLEIYDLPLKSHLILVKKGTGDRRKKSHVDFWLKQRAGRVGNRRTLIDRAGDRKVAEG